ncbi:hypothetical protein C8F01DRAFT_1088588 [Mycena amicta]|nr:hypothetical protein C8F01DRAFT_1088588 [Mycena amicta]
MARKKFRLHCQEEEEGVEQRLVVPEYDGLDVMSFASDSEDDGGGTESEDEDLAVVDVVKQHLGQTLSAAQLEALATYSSRHKTVVWSGIHAQSRQLGVLLRKLRKTNAVITDQDCQLIDATAPVSSTQVISASSGAAEDTPAPTSAARRVAISACVNPALSTGSAVEAVVHRAMGVAGRRPGNARLFLRVLNDLTDETRGDCWTQIIGDALAYRDAAHKRSKTYSSAAFQVFGTLSAFTLPDVRRLYTIALFAFPCKANLLGMTKKQIACGRLARKRSCNDRQPGWLWTRSSYIRAEHHRRGSAREIYPDGSSSPGWARY